MRGFFLCAILNPADFATSESSWTGSTLSDFSREIMFLTSVPERPQNSSRSGSVSALEMNEAAAKSDCEYHSLSGFSALSWAMVVAMACHTASSSPSAAGGGHTANAGAETRRVVATRPEIFELRDFMARSYETPTPYATPVC